MSLNVNANPVGNPVIVSAKEQTSDDTEYQRFEDSARRLVQVPKAELDAKRGSGS